MAGKPVEYDPFAQQSSGVPVEHDPFAPQKKSWKEVSGDPLQAIINKRQVPDLMSLLPPKEENPLPGIYMGATDPFYAGGRLAMETGIGDKQAMDRAIAQREAEYQNFFK
jgi:hypothetical protein